MSVRMIYQVDATRKKILDGAEQLFASRGFFDVQMTDLAAQLGLSRHTLYRYYRDKASLALAIFERMVASIREDGAIDRFRSSLAASSQTGLEKVRAWITHFLDQPGQGQALRFLTEFDNYFAVPRIDEEFRARLNAVTPVETFELLEELIRAGITDGSIRDDIDPQLLSLTLANAVRAVVQRVTLREEELKLRPGDDPAKIPETHLRLILAGLERRQP